MASQSPYKALVPDACQWEANLIQDIAKRQEEEREFNHTYKR